MPSFPMSSNGFVFILDKNVHASIQINRGLLSQFGEVKICGFSEKDTLIRLFDEGSGSSCTPIVLADSIGSMGGIAPLDLLFQLAEKYNGYLYLDDAHGTSVFGQYGSGYVLDFLQNNFHPRLILTSSLAKAFGSVAGVVQLPTKADADFVKHYCSTYIFGGPPVLPAISAAIASADIHLSGEVHRLQKKLWKNTTYFDNFYQSLSSKRR